MPQRCSALLGRLILMSLLTLAAFPLAAQQAVPAWDTHPDTWVGSDALGRALPEAHDVGPPRPHRTVGMFYFLTFDRGGDGPYDNTQILKRHPQAMADVHDPAWGPLNASHYWGEPLFGYYSSDDEWVLRKHALMLANSGVDVVIFDNSNAVTYDRAREALCRVWEDVRRRGGRTPQIAFLCPFGNPGNIGGSTLRELYDTLYAPGRYQDLWFRWEGKPLIMADPSYADAGGLRQPPRQPSGILPGGTLGQTFMAERPFTAVGGEFPTWNTTTAGMTLSLYADGPGRPLLARRRFENVPDNAGIVLEAGKTLPAGRYELEMSRAAGHIGWWGYSADVYTGGHALEDGHLAPGDRSLRVRYAGQAQAQAVSPDARRMTPEAAARQAKAMRDFFTFRTPIAPYDMQSPPSGQWAWLQNYPQAPQRSPTGQVEQVTVGVAQNYNAAAGRTAPMSFPGAFGRSYHDGHEDTRPGAARFGENFAEQWRRALTLDPPFVFVTGWNEWTAGFYQEWAGYKAPPPIFVDEFTEEYSRDIEPMKDVKIAGGHGDDYYYQLVSAVRRYKGVRALPTVTPRPISIRGGFSEWNDVGPEFRDAYGDTAHRNASGVGKAGPYVNVTGRNDIVASKVSYDAKNVYFYVRTAVPLTPHTDPNWMLLLLNTDADYKTGWLGYDFVVNRRIGARTASLERNVGGGFRWKTVGQVQYRAQGSELMLAIPRALLGIARLPAAVDFKWADNCLSQAATAADFTLNGDAAPDDRFNYRAKLR